MTTTAQERIDALSSNIDDSLEQAEKIQRTLHRTIDALGKRGVQVLIDFQGMLRNLNEEIESAQKNGQYISSQLSQLQELVHTSALLTSSLELDKVLEEVMDTVIKLTRAERAYLMLQQPDTEELRIQSARNWDRETLEADAVTFSQGIIHAAIEEGEPIVTTNAQEDARFEGLKSVISNDLRSIIVVPLILQERVVGVLYADNRIEQGVFSQENIPLLTAFANQAAIAISNARLFENVKADLEEAQKEVQRLRIEIDHNRLEEKVTEITDTEYFQYLTERAKTLRARSGDD